MEIGALRVPTRDVDPHDDEEIEDGQQARPSPDQYFSSCSVNPVHHTCVRNARCQNSLSRNHFGIVVTITAINPMVIVVVARRCNIDGIHNDTHYSRIDLK